jgi:hypothetical protein
MLKACHQSQIVYLGDFHTFDQSGRNLERIMRALKRKNKKFILCLEMVHAEHQMYLDHFLQGNLTEIEFLDSINYHEAWRFPWNHYRSIFELAKKEKISIMGINTKGTLTERDAFAATMLSSLLQIDPEARLLVLYGEYHIAHNKIPAQVNLRLPKRKIEQTIIHQNLEDVYWRLDGSEAEQVIQFKSGEFHLQTSPPWIKYESMVYWFENLTDDPEYDLHHHIMATGLKSFDANVVDHFHLITKQVTNNLKLDVKLSTMEDFNLYDQTKISTINKKIKALKNAKLKKYYANLLANHQSFKIPGENTLYCPNYSINRLSYTCGLFVFGQIKNAHNIYREALLSSNESVDIYCYLVEQSFMGFLFSKIMNPSRKCDLYMDMKEKLKKPKLSKTDAKAIRLSLGFLNQKGLPRLPKELLELHLSAKLVGHFYAHYYFKWLSGQETKALNFLKRYFHQEQASHLKLALLKQAIPTKNFKTEKKKYF